jgi:hypothetical protein
MKISDIVSEGKFNYSLNDYQEVPYDTPDLEKIYRKRKEPHIGPQEGKYLNLMLKGIKPVTLIDLDYEKELFEPYLKNGTFKLAGKLKHNDFTSSWIITLPGEEWRAPKLISLFNKLTGDDSRQEKNIHARIGLLLGLPKESIKYFLNTRFRVT